MLEQASETATETSVVSDASTESGSTLGSQGVVGAAIYSGSGTYTSSPSSTATVVQMSAESWTLSEQGTFGNGSYSISSYVFSEQQSSSTSMSESGSSTEAYSGTNQGQGYSGGDTSSISANYNVNSSSSLSAQGSEDQDAVPVYRVLKYSGTGGDSYSSSQSSSGSFSGGYSGSDSSSGSQSGNSSWSESMLGSYSGGSFSLSSDVLQVTSSAQYNNSAGGQESPSGGGTVNTSASNSSSGGETSSLYQSGMMTAGVYSNASYLLSSNVSETEATGSDDPSVGSSDTLQNSSSLVVSGSGTSGTAVGSSTTNYSWNDSSAAGPNAGSGTSSWSQSSAATLPQGVVPQSPNGTSVPAAGGSVSGTLGSSLVAATSTWMSSQGTYASQLGNNGLDLASGESPVSSGSAVGMPGGSGDSYMLYVPGQTNVSLHPLPFNPSSGGPTQQLMSNPVSYNPATGSPTIQSLQNKLLSLKDLEKNPLAALPGSGISQMPHNPATDSPTVQLLAAKETPAAPSGPFGWVNQNLPWNFLKGFGRTMAPLLKSGLGMVYGPAVQGVLTSPLIPQLSEEQDPYGLTLPPVEKQLEQTITGFMQKHRGILFPTTIDPLLTKTPEQLQQEWQEFAADGGVIAYSMINNALLNLPELAWSFRQGLETGDWTSFQENLGRTFALLVLEVGGSLEDAGLAPQTGVRGFLRSSDSYWERSVGGLAQEEAAALANKEGSGFEVGRQSRFENARDAVVIGKGNLKDGLVNRMELAEEMQHGFDRATNEASRAIRRGLSVEEFHAEVFERIIARYKAGGYQFLTPEDIQALQQAIKELRGR